METACSIQLALFVQYYEWKRINPFSPSQFTNMQNLLTLSTQNKLFSNENRANNHAQQLIYVEKQNSRNLLQGNYTDTLGEFSNMPYDVVGTEKVKKWCNLKTVVFKLFQHKNFLPRENSKNSVCTTRKRWDSYSFKQNMFQSNSFSSVQLI